MSELMQYEVGDQDLETMIRYVEDRPLLKRKLQEIRLLYREYLQYQREKFVSRRSFWIFSVRRRQALCF